MINFKSEKSKISSAYTHSTPSKETWIDRLTNKNNPWFHAVRLEERGNFIEACMFYLEDSVRSLKQGLFGRAAFSCSCAASCLSFNGNGSQAQMLYLEAARIYEENANFSINKSIRETLWSLRESYLDYILAQDNESAQNVLVKFLSLARKTNPFLKEKDLEFSLPFKVHVVNGRSKPDKKIHATIKDFLHFRNQNSHKLPQSIQISGGR